MDKNRFILPITLILVSLILGGFYFLSQISVQKSIEKQQILKIEENRRLAETNKGQDEIKTEEPIKDDIITENPPPPAQTKSPEISNSIINSCIVKAQQERERRKGLINMIWLNCLQDPLFTSSECEKYKDYSEVEQMYLEWKDNCERGIANNF